jgi:hypothetical protein
LDRFRQLVWFENSATFARRRTGDAGRERGDILDYNERANGERSRQGDVAEVHAQDKSGRIEGDEDGERREDARGGGGVEEKFGILQKRESVEPDEDAVVVIAESDGV